ncbi:hypothetical protein E1176_03895 [Fulvivirga sp. RKSG066]|uniref:hypothetical protein n=1 Tax=Fulvivirga aurantia TaxID=2529383 RepID=UPI0012BD7863|nr:hypothetical protein [Fulvivirga aurantia]MTI20152.1 hypothetical protein [Fulvivirga aurantia]
MTAQYIELHKTRDFGKKLNATIEFIKQNFKPLFKSMLYIAGPFVTLGSLFFVQIYSGFIKMSMNPQAINDPFGDNVASMIIFCIAGFVFLMIGGTAIVATVNDYIILYEEKKGPNITVSEVWARVKSSFWNVLGTMVLYFLVFMAIYIALIIPIVLFGSFSSALAAIFVIAAVIAMMYILVALTLIFIVRAYEKVGFGKALSRCFQLIKSKWWSTFGLLVVTSIIHNVISGIFFIPWYGQMIYEMMHNINGDPFQEPSLVMQIFNNVTLLLYFISSYILYCIPLIAIAFQYFNLVEMKEARGLMSKIDSFGSEQIKPEDEEHY